MSSQMIGRVSAFVVVALIATQEGLAQVGVPKVYGGVSVGTLNFSGDIEELEGLDLNFSISTLTARFGIRLHEFVSAELRGSMGLAEDSDSYAYRSFKVNAVTEVDSVFGVHVRVGIPVGSPLTPYATLGYTRISAEIALNTAVLNIPTEKISADGSDSDVSHGVGIDWKLRLFKDFRLNAEYMNYGDSNSLSVGFTLDF